MAYRRPVGKTYRWLVGGLAQQGARETAESGALGGVAGVVVMGRLVSLYSQPSACVGNGRWVGIRRRRGRRESWGGRTGWCGDRTARCEMQRKSNSSSSNKKIVDREVSRYVVCAPGACACCWGAFGSRSKG
jgi:hypothetical protein